MGLISYLWKHCPVMVWPQNPGEALPGFLTQRYRETNAQYLINLFLSRSNQTHALAPQQLLNLSLHSFPLHENKRGDFSSGPVVKPSHSSAGVWVWSLVGELRSHMPYGQEPRHKRHIEPRHIVTNSIKKTLNWSPKSNKEYKRDAATLGRYPAVFSRRFPPGRENTCVGPSAKQEHQKGVWKVLNLMMLFPKKSINERSLEGKMNFFKIELSFYFKSWYCCFVTFNYVSGKNGHNTRCAVPFFLTILAQLVFYLKCSQNWLLLHFKKTGHGGHLSVHQQMNG